MKPTLTQLLIHDRIENRFQWALERKDVDWSQIVFPDETSSFDSETSSQDSCLEMLHQTRIWKVGVVQTNIKFKANMQYLRE